MFLVIRAIVLMARAEDRATLESDPSAVPGAKDDGQGWAGFRPALLLTSDWHECDKLIVAAALGARPGVYGRA